MLKKLAYFFFSICFLLTAKLQAQDLKTNVGDNKELDSLRKKLDGASDSVVFTSKYIRYTTLKLTKDSIQTLPLDTSMRGFQNFNILAQPRRPTVSIGNLGLAARPMLFEPSKTIGFDAGFHTLDYYQLTHDDIIYYQARTAFTSLYYVSGSQAEQVLKVIHSQNIKKNWNFGANFNRIGADGIYARQRGDDLNGAIFTWYQSPNKRYNLWVNAIFNTLKAQENGAITNSQIFITPSNVTPDAENVNLNAARQLSRRNSFMIKQSYFVGRIDTLAQEITSKVLPTNKVTYTLTYDQNSYNFIKDENDDHTVIPRGLVDSVFTSDSTRYKHIQNEFIYSFFLRGKSSSVIKNELKLDVGIRHDFYNYAQYSRYANLENYYAYTNTFQNTSLLGTLGYRFSNRVDLNVDVQQIVQGRQIGDFLYEAKSNVLLSNSIGRIVLGAYLQNKSPEEIYTRYFGNHYNWLNDFERTKTLNMSFNYLNDKLKLDVGAQYYLINNYLYFAQQGTNSIVPEQAGNINLLKITAGKKFNFGKFYLESYLVYQKTDQPAVLRTPEVYTFHSFYVDQTVFKVLRTNIGFDIKYNTPFESYGYSPAAGQFFLTTAGNKLSTQPVIDVFLRATLRKANIFVKYDYVNQGLQSKGYYLTDKYPMPNRMLKFGVRWNFYD